MTTWSEQLLDVAFVLVLVSGGLALLSLGSMPLVAFAAGLGIVGGFMALPGIVRGETVWWLRRKGRS